MAPMLCPVCRTALGSSVALCPGCETPHHPDCWEFSEGCAVFACGARRARVIPADQLPVPDGATLWLDAATPDVSCGVRFDRPVAAPPRRESPAVVAVSWVYLAGSLLVAIPSLGFLMTGVAAASFDSLAIGLVWCACAWGLRTVGDLIVVGDANGRVVHIFLCLALGISIAHRLATLPMPLGHSVWFMLPAGLVMLGLLGPFVTRRGFQHFGLHSS